MFSTIRQICFVSLFFSLAFGDLAFACIPAVPADEYARFFRQDMADLNGRGELLPDWQDGSWGNIDLEASNYADWMAQVPGSSKEDVRDFVYNSTQEQLYELRKALNGGGKYAGPLAKNAFVRHIEEKKDQDLLDYMIFVKESAPILVEKDPWDYSAPDDEKTDKFINLTETRMLSAPTEFLRLRYSYQAIRLNFLRQIFPRAAELFEKHVADLETKSEVKEWCRSFYAGALARLERKNRACVEFALVFQRSSRYRKAGYLGSMDLYKWDTQGIARAEAILSEARTPEERLAVSIMAAYRDTHPDVVWPGPGSQFFSLLHVMDEGNAVPADISIILGRIINRLEKRLFSLTSIQMDKQIDKESFSMEMPFLLAERLYSDQVEENDDLKKARGMLDVLDPLVWAVRMHAPDAGLWGAGSAYLAILRGDAAAARERMDWARTQNPSPKAQAQMLVNDLLIAALYKSLDEDNENQLLAGLVWIAGADSSTKETPGSYKSEVGPNKSFLKSSDISAWTSEDYWYDRSGAHILKNILASHYIKEKQNAAAALSLAAAEKVFFTFNLAEDDSLWRGYCFSYLDALSNPQLVQIRDYSLKPDRPLTRFLAENTRKWFSPTSPVWAELEGTNYLLEHDFTQAAKTLPKSDSSLKGFLPGANAQNIEKAFLEPQRAYGSLPAALLYSGDNKKERPKMPPQSGPLAENIVLVLEQVLQDLTKVPAIFEKKADQSTLDAKKVRELVNLLNSPPKNKYDFARQMLALEELGTLPGESGARAKYIQAKGFYNMGYEGNSWELTAWTWSPMERWVYFPDSQSPEEPPTRDYYRADSARKAFLEVIKKSSDPELQARALFMASLCTQGYTQIFTKNEEDNDVARGPYILDNPDFAKLKKEFGNTEFYKAAVDSCSFLGDFARFN